MSGNIPNKDQKILYAKSGNRCAMPGCQQLLVVEKTAKDNNASQVGEMAHIKGEKFGAARYDETMSAEERNGHENLILVCPTCHKIIDDQPGTYTVNELLKIKKEHEKRIEDSIKKAILNVTFAELDVITKYLASGQASQSDSLQLIPPMDKIKKNDLSEGINNLILMGMTRVREVSNYIDQNPDLQFAERLRHGFVEEYERLKNVEKIEKDELFIRLNDFASNGKDDFKYKAAGLAVLVYLFERCEVFEK